MCIQSEVVSLMANFIGEMVLKVAPGLAGQCEGAVKWRLRLTVVGPGKGIVVILKCVRTSHSKHFRTIRVWVIVIRRHVLCLFWNRDDCGRLEGGWDGGLFQGYIKQTGLSPAQCFAFIQECKDSVQVIKEV